MGETRDKIYVALVKGAAEGLRGNALYDNIVAKVPKADNRRIVRASLLALSDPELADRSTLTAIYELAIERRLLDLVVPVHRPKLRRKKEMALQQRTGT